MRLRITPGALLLFAVMAAERDLLFWATTLAALIHEMGHLLAAKYAKIPIRMLEIDLMGAQIYPAGAIATYKGEAILAGAGPLFSLLLALPAAQGSNAFSQALLTATLSFALFNLLPIKGFDGGRLLHAPVATKYGPEAAEKLLAVTTYLSLLLLFSLSSCLLLRYGESATLAVLSASLFARLFLSLEYDPQKARI